MSFKLGASIAAFYTGKPAGGKFLKGAPVFAAGALVVWDVDILQQEVVRVYRINHLSLLHQRLTHLCLSEVKKSDSGKLTNFSF